MPFAGIDIGSTMTKVVIVDQEERSWRPSSVLPAPSIAIWP